MTSGIIPMIEREYALVREKNADKAKKNIETAMKDPVFFKTETELKSLAFYIAKAEAFDGDQNEAKRLKTRKNELFSERKKSLAKLNLTEDDLKISYDCPTCRDTGFYGGKPCKCFRDKWLYYTIDSLGMQPCEYLTFKDDTAKKTENLTKLYRSVKKYVNVFPNAKTHNFLFIGPTGCGKTHLSKIMAGELINRGFNALVATAAELNRIFLKTHLGRYDEKQDYMSALIDFDFLVIDDLGTENEYKNVTCEYFLTLVAERLAKGKHTVITTNLDREELADKYGDRFFSRVTEKRTTAVISFDNVNYRK